MSSPNFSSESSSIIRRIMSKAFRTSFFLMVFKLLCCCSISRDTFKGKVSESTIPCIFPMYTVSWCSLGSQSTYFSFLSVQYDEELMDMWLNTLLIRLDLQTDLAFKFPGLGFNLNNYLHKQKVQDYIRHQIACLNPDAIW